MRRINIHLITVCWFFLLIYLSGCSELGGSKYAQNVTFNQVGGFTDKYGQAKIRLVTYSGDAKEGNIREFAGKLGCSMMYVYYFPDTTDMSEIPAEKLAQAKNYVEARDLLFEGEGVAKWRYASQCLGMMLTVTDCVEMSISTNCR